jgi:hypothetical protein
VLYKTAVGFENVTESASKGIFVTLFDLDRDVYNVFVYESTKGVCATAERAAIRVVVPVLTEYEYTFELEVVA